LLCFVYHSINPPVFTVYAGEHSSPAACGLVGIVRAHCHLFYRLSSDMRIKYWPYSVFAMGCAMLISLSFVMYPLR
jgi:hypothetical protein